MTVLLLNYIIITRETARLRPGDKFLPVNKYLNNFPVLKNFKGNLTSFLTMPFVVIYIDHLEFIVQLVQSILSLYRQLTPTLNFINIDYNSIIILLMIFVSKIQKEWGNIHYCFIIKF